MAAVVHHDAVAAESVRNGDRNSGSGMGQSSTTVGQTHRRIRKAVRVQGFWTNPIAKSKADIASFFFLFKLFFECPNKSTLIIA